MNTAAAASSGVAPADPSDLGGRPPRTRTLSTAFVDGGQRFVHAEVASDHLPVVGRIAV